MTEQGKGKITPIGVHICPDCGATRVETQWGTDRFMYGDGPTAVELTAEVPFRKCTNCGFEYTDSEAEEARSAAIRKHLKVLLPEEISGIRHSYGMSRTEFATRTRIGPASLSRWESGQLIQNAAYDNYLYLLQFRENMDRIDQRLVEVPEQPRAARTSLVLVEFPKFRQLTEAQRHTPRAKTFSPCRGIRKAG